MLSHPSPAVRRFLPGTIILILVPLSGSIAYFHLLPAGAPLIIIGTVSLLLAAALFLRRTAIVHAALLTLFMASWAFLADIATWPALIVPLLCYACVVAAVPPLRRSGTWFRAGHFDRTLWMFIVAAILLSSTALVLWFVLWKPDLTRFLRSIPSWNPALLLVEGIGFAVLNAAMEESIYRGVMMQALDDVLGPGVRSVMLQALAFGLLHIQGIPGGRIGVAMATVYGLMLGIIRLRSRGILATLLTHVFADAVIFLILVLLVR